MNSFTQKRFSGDSSARNFLVADDLSIVLCDFSSLIIGGKKNMVRPETRYEKIESTDPLEISIATEIFAVGSLIFKITMGKRPYDELEDDEIETLFRRKAFPIPKDHILVILSQNAGSGISRL